MTKKWKVLSKKYDLLSWVVCHILSSIPISHAFFSSLSSYPFLSNIYTVLYLFPSWSLARIPKWVGWDKWWGKCRLKLPHITFVTHHKCKRLEIEKNKTFYKNFETLVQRLSFNMKQFLQHFFLTSLKNLGSCSRGFETGCKPVMLHCFSLFVCLHTCLILFFS